MERQEITGLIVNEKVNLNKKFIKNTRAILHDWKSKGEIYSIRKSLKLPSSYSEEEIIKYKIKYIKSLVGRINFIRDVRGKYDRVFLKYAKEFNELSGTETFCVSELEKRRKFIEERICVLREIMEFSQGTGISADGFGIITSSHVLANEDTSLGKSRYELIKSNELFPLKNIFLKQEIKDETKKTMVDMSWDNFCRDIINFKNVMSHMKSFKVNLIDDLSIGTKVIGAGYPEFDTFEKTSVSICETNIIAER